MTYQKLKLLMLLLIILRKDPVNIAGYTAENILKGDLEMVNYDEFWDFVKENDAVILDVRTSKEFSGGCN